MSLDAWLAHYRAQPGYSILILVERESETQYYVVYDEDGVICDWRPVE